jgi:polyferredoxin
MGLCPFSFYLKIFIIKLMGIQDRDYYKERELSKERRNKINLLVWVIVVFVVLSLVLGSFKF